MELVHDLSCINYILLYPACTDGSIRLVGGSTSNEGRVELCFGGIWGTVCDNRWDTSAARVACRQLGYSGTGNGVVWE